MPCKDGSESSMPCSAGSDSSTPFQDTTPPSCTCQREPGALRSAAIQPPGATASTRTLSCSSRTPDSTAYGRQQHATAATQSVTSKRVQSSDEGQTTHQRQTCSSGEVRQHCQPHLVCDVGTNRCNMQAHHTTSHHITHVAVGDEQDVCAWEAVSPVPHGAIVAIQPCLLFFGIGWPSSVAGQY